MLESVPHLPVLLEETVSQLVTDPNGIYLDGTLAFDVVTGNSINSSSGFVEFKIIHL